MSVDLKEIFKSELSQVSQVISDSMQSQEALVEQIGTYLFGNGGKRIRPILTILISKICNYQGNKDIYLAAAVELIHAATLLHDDVVDESTARRSMPTANFKWGNKASILVGDFLFSQSFKLMVQSDSMKALQTLAHASAIIAEGEVMQLARLYENRMLSIDEYTQIAQSKTAALFGASAQVGAIIANQPNNICNAARLYGDTLGLMFQIKDDMLDYFADSNITGKNIGDDLIQGNITLPIIMAYNTSDIEDKKILEYCFFESTNKKELLQNDLLPKVLNILHKYKIEEQINAHLKTLHQQANGAIATFPKSEIYTDCLHYILDYVINRTS